MYINENKSLAQTHNRELFSTPLASKENITDWKEIGDLEEAFIKASSH